MTPRNLKIQMMNKYYSSFKEIDRDLAQLRLKKEIESTTVKLRYEETKRALSPTTIVTDFIAGFARKAILLKIFNKIIGK